ncbi:MAG: threonylcarbamoyl-AMP synthase [Magnetococcales bacterium]|nr:threonylcarbamoyl-AMP synthase [Magnetococcales bacterium]
MTNPMPSPHELTHALETLHSGGIIAYPTETVYGIGADPFQPRGLDQILRLKGRDATKGFILLIPNRRTLETIVTPPSPWAERLIQQFWPGPLTLVLPAQPGLPEQVTGGRTTVAVRHSSSQRVATLLNAWGRPLVSTSANPSGHPPFRNHLQVQDFFGSQIPCIMTGHCPTHTPPSTIVAFENDQPVIVRQGAITAVMLGIAPHPRIDPNKMEKER